MEDIDHRIQNICTVRPIPGFVHGGWAVFLRSITRGFYGTGLFGSNCGPWPMIHLSILEEGLCSPLCKVWRLCILSSVPTIPVLPVWILH